MSNCEASCPNKEIPGCWCKQMSKLINIRFMIDPEFPSTSRCCRRRSSGGGCCSSLCWEVSQAVEVSEGVVNVVEGLEVKDISILRMKGRGSWLKVSGRRGKPCGRPAIERECSVLNRQNILVSHRVDFNYFRDQGMNNSDWKFEFYFISFR